MNNEVERGPLSTEERVFASGPVAQGLILRAPKRFHVDNMYGLHTA